MGEYFDEIKPATKQQEIIEKPLITDPNKLFAAFSNLREKKMFIEDSAYKAILPIAEELVGVKNNPNKQGQVRALQQGMKDAQVLKLEVGRIMYSACTNIENLSYQYERYIDLCEGLVGGYDHLVNSAFYILRTIQKRYNDAMLENRRLHDKIVAITGDMPQEHQMQRRPPTQYQPPVQMPQPSYPMQSPTQYTPPPSQQQPIIQKTIKQVQEPPFQPVEEVPVDERFETK